MWYNVDGWRGFSQIHGDTDRQNFRIEFIIRKYYLINIRDTGNYFTSIRQGEVSVEFTNYVP